MRRYPESAIRNHARVYMLRLVRLAKSGSAHAYCAEHELGLASECARKHGDGGEGEGVVACILHSTVPPPGLQYPGALWGVCRAPVQPWIFFVD